MNRPIVSCLRIALVVALTPVTSVLADDWPQWRGPDRDGLWKETGILDSFPTNGLKIAWRTPVGRGWSSPIVAQGRVYVTDVQIVRSNATERVLCFEETSGRLLWSHPYTVNYPDWAFDPNAGGPRSTPIVRDGKLFAQGCTGNLFCLDAVKGDVTWERNLAKDYGLEPFSGITPSPLIEEGLLILYICGKPGACVVALEKYSGKEVWRALDDVTYSSPAATSGGKRQLIVWTQAATFPRSGFRPDLVAGATPDARRHGSVHAGLRRRPTAHRRSHVQAQRGQANRFGAWPELRPAPGGS